MLSTLHVEASQRAVRSRRAPRRRVSVSRLAALFLLLLVAVAAAIGFGYAGSDNVVPEGVRVAGVAVGGMSVERALQTLEQRWRGVAETPVVFTANGHRLPIRAVTLRLRPDWGRALAEARRAGGGFGPLQGFRRLGIRLFGRELTPTVSVDRETLSLQLDLLGRSVGRLQREAAIVLDGLVPRIVRGAPGLRLDRNAASEVIVSALASLERGGPVALPVERDPVTVTARALAPALAKTRLALSAPVALRFGDRSWTVQPRRLAGMLLLPSGGARTLRFGGAQADAFFKRIDRAISHPPKDATFAAAGDTVRVVPDVPGVGLDWPRSAAAVLAAAVSPTARSASLEVTTVRAKLTTSRARAMGISGVVGAYETFFGGVPNRIHNVELVAHLIDGRLIAPGTVYSFNKATGERNAAKGFLEAPVIVNGELQTGLGGGVCQVSTTVFNAAYEAGLPILARTNHALYISHYPQGRDATVDYPGVDLRFRNDTRHWLLLRTFVTPSSLIVALYGAPLHRRVESETAPLVVTGPAPVRKVKDPALPKGKREVDQQGTPSMSTSVHRRVYAASGKLLYDDVFYSSYRGETRVVLVGTKPKPKPKKGKQAGPLLVALGRPQTIPGG